MHSTETCFGGSSPGKITSRLHAGHSTAISYLSPDEDPVQFPVPPSRTNRRLTFILREFSNSGGKSRLLIIESRYAGNDRPQFQTTFSVAKEEPYRPFQGLIQRSRQPCGNHVACLQHHRTDRAHPEGSVDFNYLCWVGHHYLLARYWLRYRDSINGLRMVRRLAPPIV